MIDAIRDILINCWVVLAQMAPYLLLGFAIAGAMSVMISADWVGRHLGGRGVWPVLKATVLGIPLPLCSCGVIPVSAGLRKQGASRGATSGFLLATPETGVDSMLATYALLGPVFAIVRPVVALVGGIVCGLMVDVFGEKDEAKREVSLTVTGDACCGGSDVSQAGDTCCSTSEKNGGRFGRAVRYGFVTLPRDIAVHLLIGVVIAGLLVGLVEPGVMDKYLGGGIVAMLVMMVIGLPLYVCATGSIPLAVAFMHMGASPGAALVFLIAGPATNAATLAVTWKLLGKRSAIIYLLVTAATALGAGMLIDALWSPGALMLPDIAHEHGGEAVTWLGHAGAAALLLVIAASFWFTRPRKSAPVTGAPAAGLTRTELGVEGMTCAHCADAVAGALRSVSGVASVEVDLAGRRAVVDATASDTAAMIGAVEQAGYSAAVRNGG